MLRGVIRYAMLHGPRSLGAYNGLPMPDICARLTAVGATHWRQNPEQCVEQVNHEAEAWSVVFGGVLSLWLVYNMAVLGVDMARASVYRAFFNRPSQVAEKAEMWAPPLEKPQQSQRTPEAATLRLLRRPPTPPPGESPTEGA